MLVNSVLFMQDDTEASVSLLTNPLYKNTAVINFNMCASIHINHVAQARKLVEAATKALELLETGEDSPAQILTDQDLASGGWWMNSATEDDRIAFINKGLRVCETGWGSEPYQFADLFCDIVYPEINFSAVCDSNKGKQIHRIGDDFYWVAK